MADATPELGRAPSYIGDVQMVHEVSDDKKAITVAFDGFRGVLLPFGPPIAMRTFSLVLPLKNMEAGARLTGGVSGNGVLNAGTTATVIVRVAGITLAFDQLFGPDEDGFTKEINLPVPAGANAPVTIIVVLEGSLTDPTAQAMVNVTTLDLQVGPGEPELQV